MREAAVSVVKEWQSHRAFHRYTISDIAPSRDPSNAPVSNTANVWPVIGTGPMGITICAARAVSKLNATTSETERVQSMGASAAADQRVGLGVMIGGAHKILSFEFRVSGSEFRVAWSSSSSEFNL